MAANPVFINDLRKSLFRRKPVLVVAYMALAILVLTLGIATGLPMGLTYQLQHMPLWRFPDLLLPVIVPAFAAGTFAKEYEQRTWQDVLLTRLNTKEILGGKFFACLLPTLAAIIVMFPPFAMLMILQGVKWAMDFGPWMLVVFVKFLISAAFYIALVMVCSFYSKSGRSALVVSYVVLACYGVFSYLCSYALLIWYYSPMVTIGNDYRYDNYGYRSDPLHASIQQFDLSTFEMISIFFSVLFTFLLFFHLNIRLGRRG